MDIIKLMENPLIRNIYIYLTKGTHFIPDKPYIRMIYRIRTGKRLELKNPQTYNEKLQWIKLYDRDERYPGLVDKYEVKKYVTDKIGPEYVASTYGVYDSFDDIDFGELPNKFVIKCTHDSGGVVVCKDKAYFDIKAAKKKINSHLKINYYYKNREWPYKYIKPRIIVEEYLADKGKDELTDYKFFCFGGEPRFLFVATDRDKAEDTKFDFFDMNYNHLDIHNGHPNAKITPEKPACFEEMKELCRVLTKDIIQCRADFYEANGRVYFGELTLFHWGGVVKFEPDKWDRVFGEFIKLPLGNGKGLEK